MKTIKPINLIMGIIVMIGGVMIMLGKADYGIILVILAILIIFMLGLRRKK